MFHRLGDMSPKKLITFLTPCLNSPTTKKTTFCVSILDRRNMMNPHNVILFDTDGPHLAAKLTLRKLTQTKIENSYDIS